MGPGSAAAAGRRREAANIDRQWRLEQQAYSLSVKQGRAIYRGGFAKLD